MVSFCGLCWMEQKQEHLGAQGGVIAHLEAHEGIFERNAVRGWSKTCRSSETVADVYFLHVLK